MKFPFDQTPYPRHVRSCPAHIRLPDGASVYVQDTNDTIYVVPDGPHLHALVLGGGLPAHYAGDLTIRKKEIVDLTNLSGTFQFDDADGLLAIAAELVRLGFSLSRGAVRLFPADGSRPRILR